MIEDREFGVTDHPPKLRQRVKVILILAVSAAWAGYLISYTFPAKYTSQSLILVETETVPQGEAQPVVPEDSSQHVAALEHQVLSQNRLESMIDRMGLATGGNSVQQVLKEIWQNARIEPAGTDLSQNQTGSGEKPGQGSGVAAFYVEYAASTPQQAQQLCSELTSMLLEEDLRSRAQATANLADSRRQLDEAKRNLDEQDHKLASFKQQHIRQLSGDAESTTTRLMVLNSQLSALFQWINLTQQNKSNAESILAQQPAKQGPPQSPASPASPGALEKQLSVLQSQLMQLQAQYTEDHPDVVRTKADIAEIKKKLSQANPAEGAGGDPKAKSKGGEPPEVRRLRAQVEQYDESIAKATREQKRIQEQIKLYQGRVLLSSSAEKQYQQRTADRDRAQEAYTNLLAKNGAAENSLDPGDPRQSERMRLANPANRPQTPTFPNRRLFAAGGLGSGLVLGLGIALGLSVRDRERARRPRPYW